MSKSNIKVLNKGVNMLNNIKDNKVVPILHGENFLVPVDKMPKGLVEKFNKYIVGHSETGHHHVLTSSAEFDTMLDKAVLYIRLFEPAELVHQKSFDVHETVKVNPGIYKVNYKTEYSPFDKIISRVFD